MPVVGLLIEWISEIVKAVGYGGIFIFMVLESAGIPIPSEAVVTFSGFLVSRGYFDFWLVIITATLANLVGSLVFYYTGYKYGDVFVVKYGKYIHLNHHHLELARYWFGKYGSITVFIGRITPVVRTYVSFPAGAGRMNINKFVIYTIAGSLIWNYFLTVIGEWLGANWLSISKYLDAIGILSIFILLLVLIYLTRKRRMNSY